MCVCLPLPWQVVVVNGVARVGAYISMSRAIGDVFDKASERERKYRRRLR